MTADPYPGSFDQWRTMQLHLLKQVARCASAHFHEPTDPANHGRDHALTALAQLHEHHNAGRKRGWQP